MKHVVTAALSACLVVLALAPGVASAQATRNDLGKRQFDENCAGCHGANGRGNGPLVSWLVRSPTDLSTLVKRNGGVFPVSKMYETIEGLNVPSHGTRDMPVWGMDYRIRAGEYYGEMAYDPEAYVRTRILALIEYIYRLQTP
jgi:mono/diheme cytochrome c family protein